MLMPDVPVTVSGVYAPCPVCQAPAASPFPKDWTVSFSRNLGRPDQITPHTAECAALRSPKPARPTVTLEFELTPEARRMIFGDSA